MPARRRTNNPAAAKGEAPPLVVVIRGSARQRGPVAPTLLCKRAGLVGRAYANRDLAVIYLLKRNISLYSIS